MSFCWKTCICNRNVNLHKSVLLSTDPADSFCLISVYISIIYPWHSLTNLLQGFYQLKGCLGTLGYLAPEALQKGVEVFFCRRFPTFPMCEWQVVCSAASEVHRNCEIRCKWQSFHIYPFQGSLQWKMWHLVPRCCLLGDVGLATQRPDPTDSTFSLVIFHVCHRRSLCIFVFEGGVSIFQRSRGTCDGYTEEALLFLVKPLCRQFVIRHMHQSRWSCVISAMSRKRSCFVVLHGLQSWLSRHWTFWGARLSLCFLGHFGALEACSTECSGLPKAFATVDFLGRVLQVVIQCYSFFLKIVSEFLWAGDCFNGIQMLDALLKKRSRCLDFTDPWHSWKAMWPTKLSRTHTSKKRGSNSCSQMRSLSVRQRKSQMESKCCDWSSTENDLLRLEFMYCSHCR